MPARNSPVDKLLTIVELTRPGAVLRLGGMSQVRTMDDGSDKGEFYRRKAAERMRLTTARLQLLRMAQLFDKLAGRIRGRERERQAAD